MSTRFEIDSRIDEIADDLEEGIPRKQLVEDYTAKWGVSQHTVERYIQFAGDILSQRMSKRDHMLDIVRCEQISESLEKMRTTTELEIKLCNIADGDIEVEKSVHTKSGMVKVQQKPDFNHIIRSIDKILRMRGRYNPKIIESEKPVVMKYYFKDKETMQMVQRTAEVL